VNVFHPTDRGSGGRADDGDNGAGFQEGANFAGGDLTAADYDDWLASENKEKWVVHLLYGGWGAECRAPTLGQWKGRKPDSVLIAICLCDLYPRLIMVRATPSPPI